MIKRISNFVLLSAFFTLNLALLSGCKKKNTDTQIKTSVETAFQADPVTSGAYVSVKDGIVTITGNCNDETSKSRSGEIAKGIKGVKDVVNNCVVAQVVPVINADDEMLNRSLTDALKDNPSVQYTLNDGKIVLKGEINRAKWVSLKQSLDKLKSKGYDLTGLKITN